jgi:hypothetical protein
LQKTQVNKVGKAENEVSKAAPRSIIGRCAGFFIAV